jgi:catechol 2,3-dioxygenase-like lactoylglutathione lyase family enzyme
VSGLDHVALSVADYPAALRFYEAALAPLSIRVLMQFDNEGGKIAGFGTDNPFLWVGDGGRLTGGRLHLALSARNRAEVDAFHAAALAAGGRDNGAPGLRPHYHASYYAAYVLDPDGHNLEAVCHAPE